MRCQLHVLCWSFTELAYTNVNFLYFLFQQFEIDKEAEGGPILSFQVPKELAEGYVNNKKENYKFRWGTCQ